MPAFARLASFGRGKLRRQPWYREVSRQEWKTFLTTFAAWTLDAFDFTILTFVLLDIQQSFEVNRALAGLLATVTLFFRVFGGIGAGILRIATGGRARSCFRSPGIPALRS